MPSPAHHTEVWIDTGDIGWQCLTCGAEQSGQTWRSAHEGADAHTNTHAREDSSAVSRA